MPQEPFPNSTPQRNPETFARHRRETRIQVWLPIGATLAFLVLFVVLVIFVEHGTLTQWQSVAIILLSIPIIIIGFLVLTVNVGGVLLIRQAYFRLPPLILRGQQGFQRLEVRVRQITDAIAEPIIKVRENWARTGVFRRNGRR